MIAAAAGVHCTKRCETVLAIAYVMAQDSLVSIAHRLANDKDKSAIALAKKLVSMPSERARALALQTISGIQGEQRRTQLVKKVVREGVGRGE